MKSVFIILVGKSGTGKSTVANILEHQYGLKEIKTYTDRPRRYAEEDTHTFISENELMALPNKVAYTIFDGHHYCTTQEQCESYDLAIFDPAGVKYFLDRYAGNKTICVVELWASGMEIIQRMRKRGDAGTKIARRMIHDLKAFATPCRVDLRLKNKNSKETACEIIKKVVELQLGE